MLPDRLAELLARLGVLERVLERGPREAGRRRAERDARVVEGPHEAAESLALVAQAPVLGDEAVLEE